MRYLFILFTILLSVSVSAEQNSRIVGGSFVDLSRTPIAYIETNRASCTGTLVGRSEVLTAAHCIADISLASTVIWINNIPRFPSAAYYSSFYSESGGVLENEGADLAMITLVTPVFDMSVVPVITDLEMAPSTPVSIYGLGSNEITGTIPSGPTNGKTANVTVSSTSAGFILSSHFLSGASACAGDSGGPMTFSAAGYEGIVGVLSGGNNAITPSGQCLLVGGTSVYTKVSTTLARSFLSFFPGVTYISGRDMIFLYWIREAIDHLIVAAENQSNKNFVKSQINQMIKDVRKANRVTRDRLRKRLARRTIRKLRGAKKATSAGKQAKLLNRAARNLLALERLPL